MDAIITRLLSAEDPCLRYKTRLRLLGEEPGTAAMRKLAEQVKSSSRIQTLLKYRTPDGALAGPPYAKFTGSHWVLSLLADLDYPPGDPTLFPLRDQVYQNWLSPELLADRIVAKEASSYKSRVGVPWIEGRARRCASQQGNALWSTLKLGIADERADELARKLLYWQWPDGGWNCDRKASAVNSSFFESLIPLRGLALHAQLRADQASQEGATRTADIFLKRKLYQRRRDGQVIHPDFIKLHYPCYWHYDILFALKVMAEVGLVDDLRCQDALDLLESKRLPDGGFPAEGKYYRVVDEPQPGGSLVDWGGTSQKRMNPWVTIDALYVLRAASKSED